MSAQKGRGKGVLKKGEKGVLKKGEEKECRKKASKIREF